MHILQNIFSCSRNCCRLLCDFDGTSLANSKKYSHDGQMVNNDNFQCTLKLHIIKQHDFNYFNAKLIHLEPIFVI